MDRAGHRRVGRALVPVSRSRARGRLPDGPRLRAVEHPRLDLARRRDAPDRIDGARPRPSRGRDGRLGLPIHSARRRAAGRQPDDAPARLPLQQHGLRRDAGEGTGRVRGRDRALYALQAVRAGHRHELLPGGPDAEHVVHGKARRRGVAQRLGGARREFRDRGRHGPDLAGDSPVFRHGGDTGGDPAAGAVVPAAVCNGSGRQPGVVRALEPDLPDAPGSGRDVLWRPGIADRARAECLPQVRSGGHDGPGDQRGASVRAARRAGEETDHGLSSRGAFDQRRADRGARRSGGDFHRRAGAGARGRARRHDRRLRRGPAGRVVMGHARSPRRVAQGAAGERPASIRPPALPIFWRRTPTTGRTATRSPRPPTAGSSFRSATRTGS